MRRVSETRQRINPVQRNYPERLTVVRSAHVSASGIYPRAAAFVSDGRACWRPGADLRDARPVNALDALRRNAEHAAPLGVFAEGREGKRAA
jgi:hypothetical protein